MPTSTNVKNTTASTNEETSMDEINLNDVWRDVPTDKLGLSSAATKSYLEAGLETLGKLADHEDLSTVSGIGGPTKKATLDAIAEFKKELSDEMGDDLDPPDVADEQADEQADDDSSDADLGANVDGESDDDLPPTADPKKKPRGNLHSVRANLPKTPEELIETTDEEIRQEFLEKITATAAEETDAGLHRMYAAAKMEDDEDMVKIVDTEIAKRFDEKRQTQMQFSLDLRFSDLYRRGYSSSVESVSRYVHKQRISHSAGVALAKLFLSMTESGETLKSGRRVTKKAHVIEKLLELADVEMKKVEEVQ